MKSLVVKVQWVWGGLIWLILINHLDVFVCKQEAKTILGQWDKRIRLDCRSDCWTLISSSQEFWTIMSRPSSRPRVMLVIWVIGLDGQRTHNLESRKLHLVTCLLSFHCVHCFCWVDNLTLKHIKTYAVCLIKTLLYVLFDFVSYKTKLC